MAAIIQLRPHGALAGRRFGSFAGKTAAGGGGSHPVSLLTQYRPHGAFAGGRFGSFAGKASGAGPTPPAEPTDVLGTPTSDTTATITWTDASGDESGFYVEIESPAGSGNWITASGGTNPTGAGVQTFSVTGLSPATAYTPGVQAYNDAGPSTFAEGPEFSTDNPGTGGGTIDDVPDAIRSRGAPGPKRAIRAERQQRTFSMEDLTVRMDDTTSAEDAEIVEVLLALVSSGVLWGR